MAGKDLWGQPRGLWVLAGTELWDRISFHGMQALLTLYMAGALLLPGRVEHVVGFAGFRAAIETVTGPLSVQALATQIFGLYVGLVYFTPAFGGFIGDRVLGRTRTVALGALLMTAGHFCLAFDASFLLALLLLILGAGALRGNLSPQVGEQFSTGDPRRETAFQIYGAAVNLGGFIAPLVTGALGQTFGWHPAFAFAGFGMLIGLIVYLAGGPWAGLAEGPRPAPRQPAAKAPPLTVDDRRRVAHLMLLLPVSTSFWIAQSQVWNTYNLWARDHVELSIGAFQMPVPWLQSIDGLCPFLLLPLGLWWWERRERQGRPQKSISRIVTGCLLFSAGTLWLAAAGHVADSHGRTPLAWVIVFHFVSNAGWLFYTPTSNALWSRAAPTGLTGLLMGVSTLTVFAGSLISGRLGGLYEVWPAWAFWSLHAAIVGAGGLTALILRRRLERVLPMSA